MTTFAASAFDSRLALQELAVNATPPKASSFVGNSFPGRANTLLHFCGIGKDLAPLIGEQPTR